MINRETLPNGVRIVTEAVPHVQSVSIGIWVASGARDETPKNMGISHFLEHMLFKGTEERTAKQIAAEFDFIGGQLNAFTEKEYTCYYAKVLAEHIPIALDVLTDMFLNSVFDPREIELEKNVVLEEIKRHEDSPDELVHDVFAQTVWCGHPLGNSVIGNHETVERLTRDDLLEYVRTRYAPDSIIVSAAGRLDHKAFVEKINGYFGNLTGKKTKTKYSTLPFSIESLKTDKSTEQVHFCIGAPGYAQSDSEKYTLALIDTALGGGMSSRLFQEIREKRGLAYSVGSYSVCYREGGLFAVYGGTSLENVDEVLELTRREFEDVQKNNLTPEELSKAKNQIRGSLVLAQENMSSRMIRMAKSEIYHGRMITVEELMSCIMKVSHEDVAEVAEGIFGKSDFPVTAIGPFNNGKA